ncbi:MAG TPA: S8 family serine peptidase [Longimicrobium sp.]|jgi:subtilisin family serine protease
MLAPGPSLATLLQPASYSPRFRERIGPATGRGVRIAVIDSGWDRGLAGTSARVTDGICLAWTGSAMEFSSDVQDRIGHGTACITLLSRVAPEAEIYPVRVFARELSSSVAALCDAIRWSVHRGCDVVNLSLGSFSPDSALPLYAACEEARSAGAIVVAASSGDGSPCYPADFDNVLSVGVGTFSTPFDFAYQADAAVECLAAPGALGHAVWLEGRILPTDEPSFAAPNIAGVVALIRERNPGAGLDEVRCQLRHLAVSVSA